MAEVGYYLAEKEEKRERAGQTTINSLSSKEKGKEESRGGDAREYGKPPLGEGKKGRKKRGGRVSGEWAARKVPSDNRALAQEKKKKKGKRGKAGGYYVTPSEFFIPNMEGKKGKKKKEK